jgi:SAM-dependent methyltransferase
MQMEFTAHNIRLDDGTYTGPSANPPMHALPWYVSARRILQTVFQGPRDKVRIADLGCLEGGYAVEFARLGYQVLGLEVRAINLLACQHVKARTNLPNLRFVQDDAWNIGRYGTFDAVFCAGLLYHLDRPRAFLEMLSKVTTRLLILPTHFSLDEPCARFGLSEITENEGLKGRWYTEFASDADFASRDTAKWSSYENKRSFWIRRDQLLQTLHDVGFDTVLEQYDSLGKDIKGGLTEGDYKTNNRSTFLGIKTGITGPG